MEWFFSATAFALGLIAGSFLNVVIHRGPAIWKLVDDPARRGNLAFPGSYCPSCGAPIRARHLIPVVGCLMLRGKCAACGGSISARYPIVELLAAGAGLAAYALFGPTFEAAFAAAFFWVLIALSAIDLETGYLPNALTLPLAAAGLAVNGAGAFIPLPDAAIGAASGYVIFRLIGEAFIRLRGAEGLGQGDAKLLAAIGAWLGWQALAPVILAASLLGLASALTMRLAGRKVSGQTAIPFGPALALAGALGLCLLATDAASVVFL